jgi:hypothetical protein
MRDVARATELSFVPAADRAYVVRVRRIDV